MSWGQSEIRRSLLQGRTEGYLVQAAVMYTALPSQLHMCTSPSTWFFVILQPMPWSEYSNLFVCKGNYPAVGTCLALGCCSSNHCRSRRHAVPFLVASLIKALKHLHRRIPGTYIYGSFFRGFSRYFPARTGAQPLVSRSPSTRKDSTGFVSSLAIKQTTEQHSNPTPTPV